MFNNIAKLIHNTLDFLFPNRCLGCQKIDNVLCSSCKQYLKPRALHKKGEKIISPFSYKDELIKNLIWHLKYKNKSEVAHIFAPYLKKELENQLNPEDKSIILIPIPLTKKRKKIKGFNHTRAIAEAIYKLNPQRFIISESLKKTRVTKNQVECHSREERLSNLQNAFTLTDSLPFKNKTIVIIDDVTTTGTTLEEAIKKIEKSSPKKIIGLTIAR